MSRFNAFFVVAFAFSNICLGAILMQWSVTKLHNHNSHNEMTKTLTVENERLSCQRLMHDHPDETSIELAEHLYEEAYHHNFDGDFKKARAASECAAYLAHGSNHWRLEAENLFK